MENQTGDGLLDYLTQMDELLTKTNKSLEELIKVQRENRQLLQSISQKSSGGSGGYAPVDDIGASPVQSLCMRGGWYYDIDDIYMEEYNGGETIDFSLEDEGPGFVLGAYAILEGKDAEKSVFRFETDRWSVERSIEEYRTLGNYSGGSAYLPYTPIYSTTDDVYGIAFQNNAGYQFTDRFKVQFDLAEESDTLVVTMLIVKVVINNMEKFTRVANVQ